MMMMKVVLVMPVVTLGLLPQSSKMMSSSSSRSRPRVTRVSMVMEKTPQQQHKSGGMVEISANNLEMTDGMRTHVEDKLGGILERYAKYINRAETHLSVNRNPRVREEADCAEVVVFAKNNVVIRAEERTSSMYASIDLVAHTLARKLRKLKERQSDRNNKKSSFRDADETLFQAPVLDQDQDQPAPRASSPAADALVRRKKFSMPKQTVAEAIEALDFVGHDFYVFTNVDSGNVNVLYRRLEGGLGLIEPDD